MVSRVLALSILVVCVFSVSDCGTNCQNGGCPACLCGEETHFVNVAQWCSQHIWDQECCKKIVMAESYGNANAIGFTGGSSFDVGLWQINVVNWRACNSGNPPCDLAENLHCAKLIWAWGGNSFKYWTTAKGTSC